MRSFRWLVTRALLGLLAAAAAVWGLLLMSVLVAFGFEGPAFTMFACGATLIAWAALVVRLLMRWTPVRARLAGWTAPLAVFAALYGPSLMGY